MRSSTAPGWKAPPRTTTDRGSAGTHAGVLHAVRAAAFAGLRGRRRPNAALVPRQRRPVPALVPRQRRPAATQLVIRLRLGVEGFHPRAQAVHFKPVHFDSSQVVTDSGSGFVRRRLIFTPILLLLLFSLWHNIRTLRTECGERAPRLPAIAPKGAPSRGTTASPGNEISGSPGGSP